MPKPQAPSEADIVFNRVNVALARSQSIIASWLPPPTAEEVEAEQITEKEVGSDDKSLFKSTPELLGVGASIPTEDAYSSPLRRTNASLDALRRQLLGPKRASALERSKAARKVDGTASNMTMLRAPGAGSSVERPEKANGPTGDASEDEEDGRTAVLGARSGGSKQGIRRKRPQCDKDDTSVETERSINQDQLHAGLDENPYRGTELEVAENIAFRSDIKPRPRSFLDEILEAKADKRKKRKRRKPNTADTIAM